MYLSCQGVYSQKLVKCVKDAWDRMGVTMYGNEGMCSLFTKTDVHVYLQ